MQHVNLFINEKAEFEKKKKRCQFFDRSKGVDGGTTTGFETLKIKSGCKN
jgi:hypothetical protein